MKIKSPSPRLLLSLFTALLLTLTLTAPAFAEVQRDTLPFDDVRPNICTAEDMHFTGLFYITTTESYDNNGGGHGTFHLRGSDFRGVGIPSGTTYIGHQEVSDIGNNFTFTKGSASAFDTEFNVNIVSHGSADNLIRRMKIHTTINANGDITSSLDTGFVDVCRG